MQGPSLVSISKVLSSHHWGMSADGDDMIGKKKKATVPRLEMLPLPGLVSKTPLETGQSRGQMDTFPTQLHSLHAFSAPSHPLCTQTAGLAHCPRDQQTLSRAHENRLVFPRETLCQDT